MSELFRDPALPCVEARRACRTRACYLPHSHPSVSIGVVDAGASVFSSGGRRVALAPGALVMVPADCVHACNPLPGGAWSYQMLHLQADWFAAELAACGAPLPMVATLNQAPQAYATFCALNACLFSAASVADKTAALRDFVASGLWRGAALPARAWPAAGSRLERVRRLLLDDPANAASLAELAALAGMSRHHFLRAFRAETGLTPHAFRLDARINRARALLRRGAALAELAQALGFADQAHFQRAFKARVALTPGRYRGRR